MGRAVVPLDAARESWFVEGASLSILEQGTFFEGENIAVTAAELIEELKASPHRMPLRHPRPWAPEFAAVLRGSHARALFPGAASPSGVLAGALLYLGCWDEAHQVAQDLDTAEGSYWHAILHRQEPDSFNAGYWFRRVGRHPIFPELAKAAATLGYPGGRGPWDPSGFIDYCESASGAGKAIAIEVQHAEWQLLLDWCRRSS
jgi:hypothetical protein